ncbi:leishmanolysin-like peptidase [Astatotilapia calliptera]|uniref:leishmanolysin-like peptidase n=1 Tax=Astatotilapia calliptera TaxID=8154 RepID=UPI000E40472B|nr:leishmanolysin like peptidase 2 [Astatotilapia calliptera]
MASPPSLNLWVGIVLVVMVVVVELPGALQRCIFDELQVRVVSATDSPPKELRLRRSEEQRSILGKSGSPTPTSPQPMRIRTWIPRESDSLSEAEKGRLEAAVEEAVRVVSSLLSVNRVPGPLLLSRDINKYCKFLWRDSSTINYNRCGRANKNYGSETCLDATIPDDHLAGCDIYPEADSHKRTVLRPEGAGVPDTDFLLYLHVQDTDKCRAEPSVLAYAVHCQTDSHGRPVAGVVVICRDRLTGATYSHQTTVQTVIHELFHALGFSKDLFSTWRDCYSSSSSQVGADCSPRGKASHSDGSGHMRIYTPSVISALQKHLVSSDPELGGPLENLEAAPGRVSSHWESRVLQGSIMSAVLGDPSTVRIDPVTLAALQDTGWYTVDLSRAQSLVWGDGEGAMFGSLSTCQDNSSSFFCTGSGRGCHFLHLHKGECQTDQYLEGCRVYKPLQNGSECWKKESSRWTAEDELSGESFGFDSRCFLSSLSTQNQSQVSSSVEGRCYRHRCTGPNRYQIQVFGSEWVDCPAGGNIQINGHNGAVFCPDRRLCLYPDVTPPLDDVRTLPACIRCEISTSAHDGTWSPLRPPTDPPVSTALCFTAAACLLAALMVSCWKCRSCMFRTRMVAPDQQGHL